MQVNWQMLWADKRKRAGMRVLGWIVLAFAVLFPVGIFTGECAQMHAAPASLPIISAAMQFKLTFLAEDTAYSSLGRL